MSILIEILAKINQGQLNSVRIKIVMMIIMMMIIMMIID